MHLNVAGLSKSFNSRAVLREIGFAAEKGEFVVLVGPSGCGKSTVLRCLAGLEQVDSGTITLNGRDLTHLEPKDRDIAMVFQDYALYPHKTVYENIAFSLRIRKFSSTDIDKRVREAAEKLGLSSHLERKPGALSGGQRQRVAIGRAMVRSPKLFLFDEPLSNLDAALRASMRITLAKLHRELNTTVVYVTHDQVEAMTLADKIIILDQGVIQQTGTPLDLYYSPKNLFVGTFIGSPPMNVLHGKVSIGKESKFISERGLSLTLPEQFVVKLQSGKSIPENVTLGIRPEDLILAKDSGRSLGAEILVAERLGPETTLYCDCSGHELHVKVPAAIDVKPGEEVRLHYSSQHFYLFDKESGASLV